MKEPGDTLLTSGMVVLSMGITSFLVRDFPSVFTWVWSWWVVVIGIIYIVWGATRYVRNG